MRKIKLTRGKFALVDDEDFEFLNECRWYCNAQGYAVRDIGGRKNRSVVWMHRVINNTPEKLRTDHINGDSLDNRKKNLRTVTASQNGHNRKSLNPNNTSGHVGVVWRKDIQKWSARIKVQYKERYLGCYSKLKDAISARKLAEKQI